VRRVLASILVAAAALAAGLALASPAGAARNLGIGFVDDRFGDNLLSNPDPAVRDKWFDRLENTNAGLARINVYWNQSVGGSPPLAPRNPLDPSYEFGRTDASVRDAQERGLRVVLTVLGAPRWAQGPNPPPESEYRVGTWRPQGDMLEDFAAALATRYSGTFIDPTESPLPLPRVRYWEAWNEPNLPLYITPQWNGKKPQSPSIYRNLLNGFYRGIHSKPGNTVIAAGTSPFGDKRGGTRMRPYYFWREVLCLKNRKKLKKKKGCAKGENRAHMDIWAHNPINDPPDGPGAKARNPDDGVPSNFKTLKKIVRKAEKKRTILPKQKKKRKGWATEVWYESKPPEKRGVSLKKQARYMQQAAYSLWRQGAGNVFFLQLRDDTYDPKVPALVNFQTGVYFLNEKPKPSLRAVQFPFVMDRVSKRKVRVWGKAPRKGNLVVQRKKGKGYRKVTRLRAREDKVFSKVIRLKGKGKFRAKVKKDKSLIWKLKR
jgi:hypothetical protein